MLGEGWGQWRSPNHLPVPLPEGASAVGSVATHREKKKRVKLSKKELFRLPASLTCFNRRIHILLLKHDGHGLVVMRVMVGLDGHFHS